MKLTPEKKEETPNKLYDAKFKVILFSELGRHKTAFIERYLINIFDSELSLGAKFWIKNLVVSKYKIKLNIFDLSSEARSRFLIPSYVLGANGVLFLYDVNRESTLLSIDEWLQIIGKKSPVVVVGIIFGPERKRQVDFEEGNKIMESRGMDSFLECNVQTGENVEKVFETLARLMLKKQSGIVSLKELFNST